VTPAELAGSIQPAQRTSSRPGFEHVRGYGVMAMPFSSGHVLVLRVFPENDFAPYTTIWHRTPERGWSIFVDGPELDTACPRYFGVAAERVAFARIELSWPEPSQLLVRMEDPRLEWTIALTTTPVLKVMNLIHPRLPEASWRPLVLVRLREWMARALFDMGDIRLIDTTPSGHQVVLMPERIYFVASSTARLEGSDLGPPTRSTDNPTIGVTKLSARPAFAFGRAYFRWNRGPVEVGAAS